MERKQRRKTSALWRSSRISKICGFRFLELLEERKKDNNEEVKAGDRLAFNSFNYGYGGFVFKPENLSKIINWSKEQKIPQKNIKIEIFNHRIKKWQSLSKNEIKELLESKNPLKTSEKIAKNRE